MIPLSDNFDKVRTLSGGKCLPHGLDTSFGSFHEPKLFACSGHSNIEML